MLGSGRKCRDRAREVPEGALELNAFTGFGRGSKVEGARSEECHA
jgi:hypothetical protein